VLGFQATLAKANTEDLTVLRAVDVKQTLTTHVQSLARTVDVDWHDSYEETAEEVCEWGFKCGVVVEACFRVSVCHGVAFGRATRYSRLLPTPGNHQRYPFPRQHI